MFKKIEIEQRPQYYFNTKKGILFIFKRIKRKFNACTYNRLYNTNIIKSVL